MKLYVMDAFANRIFGGNQAGVALPDRELSDETMRQIAAEMKHSETAFYTYGAGRLPYPCAISPPPGRWTCAATLPWRPSPCCGSWRRSATATTRPIRRPGN